MILSGVTLFGSVLFIASPTAGGCDAVVTDQVPFDVRSNGDDAVTQRLAEEVERAYTSGCAAGFVFTNGRGYAALVVNLTGNVTVRPVGKRSRAYYSVSYQVQGRAPTRSKGSCWEDRLSDCASKIVEATPAISMA